MAKGLRLRKTRLFVGVALLSPALSLFIVVSPTSTNGVVSYTKKWAKLLGSDYEMGPMVWGRDRDEGGSRALAVLSSKPQFFVLKVSDGTTRYSTSTFIMPLVLPKAQYVDSSKNGDYIAWIEGGRSPR